ncbi:MAG: ParA family protein [Anaerolineaceae bacterium]
MSYIIAIANEKGGVAKTTTTLSLGAALVENGAKVLVVDLDAQANLTLALGVEPSKVSRSIANILLEGDLPASSCQETGVPGLDLIPANSEMGLAERFLPIRQDYEFILRQSLEKSFPNNYDYILLDCPPFLGAVTFNALTAAQMLLIPTQAEYLSIHAIRNMLAAVRKIRENNNPGLSYRLLVTMFDRRNRTHRTLAEQLRSTFGQGLMETSIFTDTKLRESPIAGLPVIYYAPKSRASEQYRALAQEINQYVQETAEQPA